jgi:hypothetical protein
MALNIEKLLSSPDADERTQGIDAVLANQSIKGALALSLLKDLSCDREAKVRAAAIHEMAVFDGPYSQALLREASCGPSSKVRLMAMDALGVS